MLVFWFQVPLLSENLDTTLSKLCWSPNGQHLACGDIEGKVHLFETGEVSINILETDVDHNWS